MGISLATMVANLSASKKGWEERWMEFSQWAEKGQDLKNQLLYMVDEDTRAFNLIMDAFKLPKSTDSEKTARKNAIQEATKYAIEVPYKVMQLAYASMEIILEMAKSGNPNSVSDAGVGALCARTAVSGAFLNVKINAASYDDKPFANDLVAKAAQMELDAIEAEKTIMDIVNTKISG